MNCPECGARASHVAGTGAEPLWSCPECGAEFRRVPVHDPRARHTQEDEAQRRAHQRDREKGQR